jgi:ubiquinone/menaquinone biosynthesis C-methylase UbiE
MGIYQDQVLPRLINRVLDNGEFAKVRRRVCAGLAGDVLELGFGSGLNVPHYPAAVTRVLAVDPATLGRRLAAGRVARSRIPVEYVGLDGQSVGVDAESVDHVLVTWTLCTIPDAGAALSEARRVLKKGGALHFVEHGLAPDPRVARWQDRLTPLQRAVAGGCHLNRPIADLVAGSGLEIERIENYYMDGPKPLGYIYEGVAVRK